MRPTVQSYYSYYEVVRRCYVDRNRNEAVSHVLAAIASYTYIVHTCYFYFFSISISHRRYMKRLRRPATIVLYCIIVEDYVDVSIRILACE